MANPIREGKHDYFIRQIGEVKFTVTKFDTDGAMPLGEYNVTWNSSTEVGKCDCPAGTYRRMGAADKHVKLVKQWLESQGDQNVNQS